MHCSTIPAHEASSVMIDIEKREEVCILHFKGDFRTGEDLDYLRAKLDAIRALNCSKIVADFQGVPTIGSTGLTFLIGLYRASAGRFALSGIQPRVREVLEITRLNLVISLAENLDAALTVLRGEPCVL